MHSNGETECIAPFFDLTSQRFDDSRQSSNPHASTCDLTFMEYRTPVLNGADRRLKNRR